jgi:hypothetical protein
MGGLIDEAAALRFPGKRRDSAGNVAPATQTAADRAAQAKI